MTKNKKNLTWKLADLPTGGELADLVNAGVIDAEEAREIMFGTAENDKEKIKSLEELVEFLQDLVKELSKNRNTTTFVPITKTVYHTETPSWNKYWGDTNKILCANGLAVSSTTGNIGTGKLVSSAAGKGNHWQSDKNVTLTVSAGVAGGGVASFNGASSTIS